MCIRDSNSAKAILEGGAREGDGPVILQCDLYVKKTGLTNTRYVKHFCTLSYTEGADGRTGCRLSYQESQCIVREITIVGVDDEVAARLEFTIVSDGDQAYSVRAFYRAEFEQWTEAIKKIVAPPLSRQNSEGAAPTRTSTGSAVGEVFTAHLPFLLPNSASFVLLYRTGTGGT